MATPQEVLSFWTEEVGPKGWYAPDADLDDTIQQRFRADWEAARDGRLAEWRSDAAGTLAYIIVTDQFGRNMFRGDPRAFALDARAVAAAKSGIARDWDRQVAEPERQFYYLPLMHSENGCDQDRCVRLIKDRMSPDAAQTLLHARAHREVIRKFGRFPHRNETLGRRTAPKEQDFLEAGGYGAAVREVEVA